MPTPILKYLCIVEVFLADQKLIPTLKIEEFLDIVNHLLRQPSVTMKMLKSFLGRVNYLGKAVHPARLFISRTLQLIRDNYQAHVVPVDTRLTADLKWFSRFLPKYNGASVIKPPQPSKVILADSCLTAGGATDYSRFYEFVFSQKVAEAYYITVLEAINWSHFACSWPMRTIIHVLGFAVIA